MCSLRKHEETWRLLQPEIMTREQLLTILQERNVLVNEESTESDKSRLIEIYRKIAMPLSQRSRFQCQLPNLDSICLDDKSVKNWSPSNNAGSCNQIIDERVSRQPVNDTQPGRNSTPISLKTAVKRTAVEMKNSDQNPILKKREKISWP